MWSKVDTDTCELLQYYFGLYTVLKCQVMGPTYVDVEFQTFEIANGFKNCGMWPNLKMDWAPKNISEVTIIPGRVTTCMPGRVTTRMPGRDLPMSSTQSCVLLPATNPFPTEWTTNAQGEAVVPHFPDDVYPSCPSPAPFPTPTGQQVWLGPAWPAYRFK